MSLVLLAKNTISDDALLNMEYQNTTLAWGLMKFTYCCK